MYYRILNDKFKTIGFSKNNYEGEYVSVATYPEETVVQWNKTGKLILDNFAIDRLYFDVESENLNNAKIETLKLIDLLTEDGYNSNNIEIRYTGNKGFHVLVDNIKKLNNIELLDYCKNVSEKIKGTDLVIYSASQVLRNVGSINTKSGKKCIRVEKNYLLNDIA